VLGNLGELLVRQQALVQAQDCFRAALAIAREVGYRRAEGGVLGSLAELLAAQGKVDDARAAASQGATILRELGDRVALGKLLCVRAEIELGDGAMDTARAALDEAQAHAIAVGALPDSELGRKVAEVRRGISPVMAVPR
jgi:hypothetical protein